MKKWMARLEGNPWELPTLIVGEVEVLKVTAKQAAVEPSKVTGYGTRFPASALFDSREAALESVRADVEARIAAIDECVKALRAVLSGDISNSRDRK